MVAVDARRRTRQRAFGHDHLPVTAKKTESPTAKTRPRRNRWRRRCRARSAEEREGACSFDPSRTLEQRSWSKGLMEAGSRATPPLFQRLGIGQIVNRTWLTEFVESEKHAFRYSFT